MLEERVTKVLRMGTGLACLEFDTLEKDRFKQVFIIETTKLLKLSQGDNNLYVPEFDIPAFREALHEAQVDMLDYNPELERNVRAQMGEKAPVNCWKIHPNGGGLVHVEATVSPLAHVDLAARVCMGATIEPGAFIGPGVTVRKLAIVDSGAIVQGGSTIGASAYVGKNAIVTSGVQVSPKQHVPSDIVFTKFGMVDLTYEPGEDDEACDVESPESLSVCAVDNGDGEPQKTEQGVPSNDNGQSVN